MGERGYERSSIKAIADKAGVASGLVHHYFSNKQEILLALVETLAGDLLARYERKVSGAGDHPQARLDAFLEAYLAVGEDASPEAVACWVSIGDEARHYPEVKRAYEDVLRTTLEHVKLHLMEVLANEGRQPDNIHHIAAGIVSAIEGAYKLAVTSSGLVPEGFAYPTIKAMTRGVLDSQPFRQDNAKGAET
jgi:TetR/AcrR family transcriptional repressor of bet genes